MSSYLYGLEHATHDFQNPESLGKNIFTNAFPLAMAQYLTVERRLDVPTIKAELANGKLVTRQHMMAWPDIIKTSPDSAYFAFENVFDGYNKYTHSFANKSDVVVCDRKSGQHLRPLEIKLVVVPTSSSAKKPKVEQSCEIVVRPPTVEQLAFSIAHSYGQSRRQELQEMIAKALGKPNDYEWTNEKEMIRSLPKIFEAAENIATGGLNDQTPLVLNAVWRSEGQRPVLDQNAFDVFAWTDMAFVQLFINHTRRAYFDNSGSRKIKVPKTISRPSRTLIWLIVSLWDYSTQGTLDFRRHHSRIIFGGQSDKAGSFSNNASLEHLMSPEFLEPRITRDELEAILSPTALEYLMPERRLDAAITIQHLAKQRAHGEASGANGGAVDIVTSEPKTSIEYDETRDQDIDRVESDSV